MCGGLRQSIALVQESRVADRESLAEALTVLKKGPDLDKPTDKKPTFRCSFSSESALLARRLAWDGASLPEDIENSAAGQKENSGRPLLVTKIVDLPKIAEKNGKDTDYSTSWAERCKIIREDHHEKGEAGDIAEVGSQMGSRAQRYFALLMQGHNNRISAWDSAEEGKKRKKAEFASYSADQRAKTANVTHEVEDDRPSSASSSRLSKASTADDGSRNRVSEDEDDDRTYELVQFDGQMKVKLEVLINKPIDFANEDEDIRQSMPGVLEAGDSPRSLSSTNRSSENENPKRGSNWDIGTVDLDLDIGVDRNEAGHGNGRNVAGGLDDDKANGSQDGEGGGINLYEELEALRDEVGEDDVESSDHSDDMPAGLKSKGNNIWDCPVPKWSIGLGGTVFFVPDAERYGMGASLPPPPPPSLHGRHRIRLKPRLPIEISNHRYRDECPNIWPDPPYQPEVHDYLRFEEKLMTLDFYKSCNKALLSMHPLEKAADAPKQRVRFGGLVGMATKSSQAWKNWRHREKVKLLEKQAKPKAEAGQLEAKQTMAGV